jgi:membrane protein YdbS with pleckstrin-like domain
MSTKLNPKKLIGIFLTAFLFFGFVYLYTGGKNYWATVGSLIILTVFILIIVGIIRIIIWLFESS